MTFVTEITKEHDGMRRRLYRCGLDFCLSCEGVFKLYGGERFLVPCYSDMGHKYGLSFLVPASEELQAWAKSVHTGLLYLVRHGGDEWKRYNKRETKRIADFMRSVDTQAMAGTGCEERFIRAFCDVRDVFCEAAKNGNRVHIS